MKNSTRRREARTVLSVWPTASAAAVVAVDGTDTMVFNGGDGADQVDVSAHFHGAVTRVGATESAVPHRDEGWNLLLPSVWTDPDEREANIAWTRETFAAPPACGRRS